MSPSESDLRAALQHGDDAGGYVNPDAIIAGVQAIRARRVRILSGAAAAVLVAGGALGLAVVRGDGGSGSQAGGGNALQDNTVPKHPGRQPAGGVIAPNPAETRAAHSAASTLAPVPGGTADYAASCPDTVPNLVAPGGGSSGQFGADDPLFAKPVSTLIVCSYGAPLEAKNTVPARLVLAGARADAVVSSLEDSSRTARTDVCDPGGSSTSQLLAFIGVTSSGHSLPPVTTTLTTPPCNVRVTNGTAVRYDWTPPDKLAAELRDLAPPQHEPITVPPDLPTVGHVQGSPIHS